MTEETPVNWFKNGRMVKSGDDNKKHIMTADGHHVHASVSVRKLEKRIVRLTAQAIADYGMIREGDKVAVAMSGGKDSYVLLEVLRKVLTEFYS